ncbi:MAG: 4Fe-4S binding protein [Balneolaceae bacterium]
MSRIDVNRNEPKSSERSDSQAELSRRLGTVRYRNQSKSDFKPHIKVNTDICNSTCPHRGTTTTCPANCYTIDDHGVVHFQVEDCIECGTCMYVCDQGAVSWEFPDPEKGRGVTWNFG